MADVCAICRDEPLRLHEHDACHVCGGYRANPAKPTCHACDRARPRCDTCRWWETWEHDSDHGQCRRAVERETSDSIPSIEEPMTLSVDCNGGGIALVTLASFSCDAYDEGTFSTREGRT